MAAGVKPDSELGSDDPMRAVGCSRAPTVKFVAIAFSDYDGIGFEFYSTVRVVRPYFEKMREKKEEACGSGWDARKKKSEFLQRVSITIAKGNSRVLACMRHDWQSATAPDLITSTVHNPRTVAATSRAMRSALLAPL